MELILNLAWAVLAVGLAWLWLRGTRSNPAPRSTQILALLVVVLLLLPVISLSDDLMATQGLAETDCCLRRALDSSNCQHSVIPASFALPEQVISDLWTSGYSQEVVQSYDSTLPPIFFTPSLNSRPPPAA